MIRDITIENYRLFEKFQLEGLTQVNATTHSWDCLSSFQKVLTEEKEETIGSVFRLERTDNQIGYVAYTGEELAVAVEHDIEVR
jgi:hypothetical protein